MKKLLIVTVLLSAAYARAQAPEYDDLRILYAEDKWEKLVKEADKYANSEKTGKDALPHMWLAQGLYQVSLSNTDDEDFKNAYKDAVGALAKALKNDKDSTVRRQEEHDKFIGEFKMSLYERIANDVSTGDFRKASGWVLKYYKIDANSIGTKYADGACKFKAADKGGANALWKDADARLAKVTSLDGWHEGDKQMLKIGVMMTADCLVSMRQGEKAKTLLGKVAQWFEGDEEFKAKYDEIVNK